MEDKKRIAAYKREHWESGREERELKRRINEQVREREKIEKRKLRVLHREQFRKLKRDLADYKEHLMLEAEQSKYYKSAGNASSVGTTEETQSAKGETLEETSSSRD